MEEYYYKADDRKPWQKSLLLAWMVLILLFAADVLQSIPRKVMMFSGNLVKKKQRRSAKPSPASQNDPLKENENRAPAEIHGTLLRSE